MRWSPHVDRILICLLILGLLAWTVLSLIFVMVSLSLFYANDSCSRCSKPGLFRTMLWEPSPTDPMLRIVRRWLLIFYPQL